METGTKAAQFPEKEYINFIFIAVHYVQACFFPLAGSDLRLWKNPPKSCASSKLNVDMHIAQFPQFFRGRLVQIKI